MLAARLGKEFGLTPSSTISLSVSRTVRRRPGEVAVVIALPRLAAEEQDDDQHADQGQRPDGHQGAEHR